MPRFQETHLREDTVQRVRLAQDDLDFLKALQSQLNTQDTMCNADPRFWVIRQTEAQRCDEESADETNIVDESGATVATDFESFMKYLRENPVDDVIVRENRHGWLVDVDLPGWTESQPVSSLEDMLELLTDAGCREFWPVYYKNVEVTVPDTLFLTHKECEDHLRKYGHNYKPDAHAYAMTAIRSPQVERLVKLLQTADWDYLAYREGTS